MKFCEHVNTCENDRKKTQMKPSSAVPHVPSLQGQSAADKKCGGRVRADYFPVCWRRESVLILLLLFFFNTSEELKGNALEFHQHVCYLQSRERSVSDGACARSLF